MRGTGQRTMSETWPDNASLSELAGDSYRFESFTPKSFDNKVVAGWFQNIIIKNCGENNTVIGGQLVDSTQDPCF